MRGYGGSSAPGDTTAYRIEEVVADLAELHDHLGGSPAVWVGHDWGSIVVGALAAHEAQRARAAVLTSWAYFPRSNSLATLVPLVDRTIYPAAEYPDGQWDYYRYYTTHLDSAVADLDAAPADSLAGIYLPGDPRAVGRVAPSATVTRTAPDGGHLRLPVLFVNGAFDLICSIDGNRQGDPMRAACDDLTVTGLPAGHWLPVERKAELTAVIRDWLRLREL